MGPWYDQTIMQYAPDLQVGVAPWPGVKQREATGSTGYFNADTCYIPKGSKQPAKAFDLLSFIISDQGNSIINEGKYPDAQGRQPVLRSTNTAQYIANSPNRFIKAHIDIMKSSNMVGAPEIPTFASFQEQMTIVYQKAMANDGDVRANLQAALDTAQKELDKYYQRKQ